MLLESLVVIAFVILLAYFLKRNRSEEEMPLIIEDSRVEDPRKTSKAVVLHSKSGPYTVVHDWPRPRIGPKELLIKVHAIGLNPIDWKCVAYGFGIHSTPWISGRETAGVVEEVGLEVPDFRKGDRVFVTSTNYRDIRTSTFQEYVAALPFNVGRLPEWISFEEGATLGVGSVAAAAALFDGLEIPRSPIRRQDPPWILIWGGSCVTGMMAIQFAKQSGFSVLAVADLQNEAYLKSLGADQVLDRHQPENTIALARQLDISLAVDCVGQQTATSAVKALQPGGKLAYLVKQPDQAMAESFGVDATDILIKRFHEDPEYGQSLVDYVSYALLTQKIRPVRYDVVPGQLEAIQKGLKRLESQTVSGRKLVVRVGS